MNKKLKIRFVKFDCVLTMQILEQEGEFKESEHIRLNIFSGLYNDCVFLNSWISSMHFYTNQERDEYLNKVIRWISEEQFAEGSGELRVDEMCEVRDVPRGEWKQRKLIAILPKRFANRFIVEDDCDNCDWTYFVYARPIGRRIEPKIDGDIYTWEEK